LEAAWDDLFRITHGLLQASKNLHGRSAPHGLQQAHAQYEDESRSLLIEPTDQFARLRPIRRSLEAMREFDRQASAASVRRRERIDVGFEDLLCSAGLKIRQPLEPAFAPLRGELQKEDLFTLLVIQEHGSLEYHEISEVLFEDPEISRARIDRLVSLGLVDKDPDHPGSRVRPEAHRFVSAALRRVNLTEELV
jgi:hypothetical protein